MKVMIVSENEKSLGNTITSVIGWIGALVWVLLSFDPFGSLGPDGTWMRQFDLWLVSQKWGALEPYEYWRHTQEINWNSDWNWVGAEILKAIIFFGILAIWAYMVYGARNGFGSSEDEQIN